jgi:hypothetical protein
VREGSRDVIRQVFLNTPQVPPARQATSTHAA